MGWGGRWDGGSGWGTHVNTWLIQVNVWQKPPQYCEVISLQPIKINEKKIYLRIKHNVKEYEIEYIYIRITESLCCTAEINTTL